VSEEVTLGGGWSTDGVVRVGDTVRRPSVHATQTMRDVLVQLESVGFDEAPRWLGFDAQGRDVLTYVDGDTYSDCREIVWHDDQLAASGALLRRYHDATAGSSVAAGREVVCHGDFGPWNLIWRGGRPAAVIDFDNAHPGDRVEDVGYALRAHLNLALVAIPPAEQARRAAVVTAGYGLPIDIASALDAEYDTAEARCRSNGWLKELARLADERRWLDRHRNLLR
jgi:aminoglycoside phosphotransferase (APT) family kinase protein